MGDDPGVLGNLPRSRPGRRSDKRGGTWSEAAGSAAASGGASEAPKRPARPARKPSAAARTGTSRRHTSPGTGTAQRSAREAPTPQRGGDPVSGAIRAAGGLAEAGVKTWVRVAGGVLKRLPRP
jgi:hypothetical protein